MKVFGAVIFVALCIINGQHLYADALKADSTEIPSEAALLSTYVQIPSVTGDERDAGVFLSALSGKSGLHVHVFTDEQDSYNFAASLYPLDLGMPNIVFLNHIDVVPPGEEHLWTYPPFSGKIADGYVWGRGALDNKSMGIMQLMALSAFVQAAGEVRYPYNVTMLSVSNEEKSGLKGASLIVDKYLAELNPVAVYGEGGTGLAGIVQSQPDLAIFGIEIASKMALWFKVSAQDPEMGHGSVPMQMYPAKQIVGATHGLITKRRPIRLTPPARQMLRMIGTYERGMRGFALRNIGFFRHFIGNTLRNDPFTNALLTNTITLTDIGNSDGAYNQVAHSVWAAFDCRLLPGTDTDDFVNELKAHFYDSYYDFEVIMNTPASGISEQGIYYNALEQAVNEVFPDAAVAPILFPAHNDNAFFRKKGVPAYGLLPALLSRPEIDAIHNIDERISIKALTDGIAVYSALMSILLSR